MSGASTASLRRAASHVSRKEPAMSPPGKSSGTAPSSASAHAATFAAGNSTQAARRSPDGRHGASASAASSGATSCPSGSSAPYDASVSAV